jgi:uncharacterized cupredoxin-like copper-binding protein
MTRSARTSLAGAALVAAFAIPAQAASTARLSAADSGGKLRFSTKTLTVRHGKVTIRMHNGGSFRHGIAIEGHGVDKDGRIVASGRTSTLTLTLKKGTYTFYCPVPGHEAAGMKGKLVVK